MAAGDDSFQTHAVLADARVARGLQAQFQSRDRALEGAEPLGWKIGLNAPAAMERLGTAGPVLGYLTRDGLLAQGDELLVAEMTHPGFEPELAIHLGADIDARATAEDAQMAIAGIGAAVEIVDVDRPIDDVEQILAGNVFHRRVLLGTETSGLDDLALPRAVAVTRNSEQIAEAASIPTVGQLVATVLHLAMLLGSQDERLRGGETIIAGSLTPILEIAAGDRFAADFGPLGTLELGFA